MIEHTPSLHCCYCLLQVTYKRLQETLQQLSAPSTDSSSQQLPGRALIDVIFGGREPRFAAQQPAWKAVNQQLDASQRKAVDLALRAQDVALIHGPPGTHQAGIGRGDILCAGMPLYQQSKLQ